MLHSFWYLLFFFGRHSAKQEKGSLVRFLATAENRTPFWIAELCTHRGIPVFLCVCCFSECSCFFLLVMFILVSILFRFDRHVFTVQLNPQDMLPPATFWKSLGGRCLSSPPPVQKSLRVSSRTEGGLTYSAHVFDHCARRFSSFFSPNLCSHSRTKYRHNIPVQTRHYTPP